jgi:nucleoid DNA-binding protein
MKPPEILDLLKQQDRGEEAADALARAVESILKRLKRGESVSLPGLGRLVPEGGRQVRLEPAPKRGGRREPR